MCSKAIKMKYLSNRATTAKWVIQLDIKNGITDSSEAVQVGQNAPRGEQEEELCLPNLSVLWMTTAAYDALQAGLGQGRLFRLNLHV
eukprot:6188585-Pleurochrysis_carterae.AAC.8